MSANVLSMPLDFPPTQRLALGLTYQGSAWQGWQTQPHGFTIQDQLQQAISRFTSTYPKIIAAGRTDAGVHACMQVIHFDTPIERAPAAWVRGLNAYLPSSIAVRWACVVPDTFHARFSAQSRTYIYLIMNDPVRSPLWQQRAAWCFRPLNISDMQRAARVLIGEHDFTSFRAAECQANRPIRHIYDLQIEQRGKLISVKIQANAFLQHMVRNMVGALVYIGMGKRPVEWMTTLLEARDRQLAAPTYGPEGLYFCAVDYEKPSGTSEANLYNGAYVQPLESLSFNLPCTDASQDVWFAI